MKKYFALAVAFFVMLGFTSVFAETVPAELPNVKIIINGEQKVFTDVPIAVNEHTLLPLRQCLVYLGIPDDDEHIIWNQSDQSVTVKDNDTQIYLKLYDNKAIVNGNQIILPAASTAYKERTYIPARFIAEALNKKVEWDDKYKAVYIAELQTYEQVKSVLDKVHEETKNIKDITYTIDYDLDVRLEGNVPEDLPATSEKHSASDIVKCDFINNVTHFVLGDQGFTANEYLSQTKEGYYTNDCAYIKVGDTWLKNTLADGDTSSAEVTFHPGTESFSSTSTSPRSSQIVLNNLSGALRDTQYAGFIANDSLSNENTITLNGDTYFDYVYFKTLSVLPVSELGVQTVLATLFGAELVDNSTKTQIYIDKQTNKVNKIIFRPYLKYQIVYAKNEGLPEEPLYIIISGNITHNYKEYNQNITVTVPDEVKNITSQNSFTEDFTEDLTDAPKSKQDFSKIRYSQTLAEVTNILGEGNKISSQTEYVYIWGDIKRIGKFIELSFIDNVLTYKSYSKDYEEEKLEQIENWCSFEEAFCVLGEYQSVKETALEEYRWNYPDGSYILLRFKNNKVFNKDLKE